MVGLVLGGWVPQSPETPQPLINVPWPLPPPPGPLCKVSTVHYPMPLYYPTLPFVRLLFLMIVVFQGTHCPRVD